VDNNAFNDTEELKLDTASIAAEWAEIVLERFMAGLDKYKVGTQFGELYNSFKKELEKSNGDVAAVIFKFLKYGRFVDMGVGKGVSLGKRTINRQFEVYKDYRGKTVGRLARKRKPWYSKTFYREVAILSKLFQEHIGDNVMRPIESALSGTITLTM
jgi:hypothetical protein